MFTLRLPDGLEERLEKYCLLTAATKTGVVALALEDFLERRQAPRAVAASGVVDGLGGKRYSGPDPK